MALNTSNWKEFNITDLFDVVLSKGDCQKDKLPDGNIPLITSGYTNNGIAKYVAFGDGIAELFSGNVITVDMFGYAFYRETDFYSVSHGRVNILLPKIKLTENTGKFIAKSIETVTRQAFEFARMCSSTQLAKIIIKLPADTDGKPDYRFMENYINDINSDITNIPDYFLTEGFNKACWYMDNIDCTEFEAKYAGINAPANIKLTDRAWREFRLGDIVDTIRKGISYNDGELASVSTADTNDYYAYITRSDNNNGIKKFIPADEYKGLEDACAITIGDTTTTIFYQSMPFVVGQHIVVIRARWFNVYTANFLVSILNLEKEKYPVFGRAFLIDLVKDTMIKLPVDSDGKPDYQFMEDYIKSRPFSINM